MPVQTIISNAAAPGAGSLEWQAIVERNARFDGIVYYGVTSTGIFCKPSCPSRKPLPKNVRLFFDRSEAERSGFRPCRRCRPEADGKANAQVEAVRRVCRHVEKNLDSALPLRELAMKAGMNATHLQKVFKRLTGVSPRKYIEARRLAAFKLELRVNRRDVTEATYEVGYGSSSRIYERATERIGMTPGTYRKGAPGVTIRYATAPCSLGRLLLAATDRGICSVKVGDSDSMLTRELFSEFPRAHMTADQESLAGWLGEVVREVEAGDEAVALPLDVQATAFQQRVYEALKRIPLGETRSYAQIAAEIGAPQAHRAVARACATNPVTIVIPCHRVVRSDGSFGGYRWGEERKQTLLERERKGSKQREKAAEAGSKRA